MKKMIVAALFLSALPLAAQEASTWTWKSQAQLSFLNANGNTKSTTLGAKNDLSGSKGRWTIDLPASALTSKSRGERTAEQYSAGEKVQFKINDRNYAFEKYTWTRDTFAGYDHRHDASLGFGREFIKTERDLLLGELGGGYVNEQRVAPNPRNDFSSGRAYAKYTRKLSATAEGGQDAEYLHNFEDSGDYRFNAETSVTASVTTAVSLKFSYTLKYVNEPPTGFGKTDTLTAATFIINY